MTTTPARSRSTWSHPHPPEAASPGPTRSPGLSRGATTLTATAAGLALVATTVGLVTDGVYAGDAATAAMLRGYDLVTLVVALPVLVLGLIGARRGTLVGPVLTASLLAYTAYTYAYYVFGTGFNALFLVHVATLAVASVALLLVLAGLDLEPFRTRARRLPARTVAGLLGPLALSLGGMWVYHAAANAVTGEVPVGSALVESDLVVHLGMALDLAVLVPLYGVAAVLVWRRTAWGLVLAAVAAVAGLLHQASYVVAMPFQVAADVPGAVTRDPFEPVIVAVYVALTVLVLRGLIRGGSGQPPR